MHASPRVSIDSEARHLFAYGTLTDPRCLDDVLGHRHRGERLRARLPGYRRVTSGSPFAYIVAAQESSVDGVVVMDLSPADLEVLDEYEDVEKGMYRREVVEVETWGCGPRTLRLHVFTYAAGPALIAVNQ